MAKILPYKHATAVYGTALTDLSSQIAYDGWLAKKNHY
jgi:hypothetical protein